jgi:hypothetical protein
MGFDGIIVLDNRLYGARKMQLALKAASTIVEATISSDRLGLVVGDMLVSELIMCTVPYKVALQKSVMGVTTTTTTAAAAEKESLDGGVWKGIHLAGQLLSKEARSGGHIFLISDGHHLSEETADKAAPSNTSRTPPTTHVIAIGELVHSTLLRKIRGERGMYIEYRELGKMFDVNEFLGCLALQAYCSQSIGTVRCRLSHPPEVMITSVLPSSLSLDPSFSLTLRKSPFYPYTPHPTILPNFSSPCCSYLLHLTNTLSYLYFINHV